MAHTTGGPDQPVKPHVRPETRIAVVEEQFTRQWHTDRWRLRDSTRRWMVAQRLLTDDIAAAYAEDVLRYPDLVAGYYVGATRPAVQAICEFSAWFFVFDDWHAVTARHARDTVWANHMASMFAALHDPDSHRDHTEPLVASFADSLARFFVALGPRWNTRFREHAAAMINAYDQEYRNLRAGVVPTAAEFLRLRRGTFAYDVWIDLLELAAGHELPAHIYDSDVYQRAAQASQEFSSSYNDLCSLGKEVAGGEIHNLGISLMHHEGMDIDQAIDAVCTRAAERVARFLRAEARLQELLATEPWPPEVKETVRSCLYNQRNWISSVYWFHHESGRYRVHDWVDPARPPYVAGDRS